MMFNNVILFYFRYIYNYIQLFILHFLYLNYYYIESIRAESDQMMIIDDF